MNNDAAKLPIKIKPDCCYMGLGYLLIGDGDQTYHIDLQAFFAHAPMASIRIAYHDYCQQQDADTLQRIAETRHNEQK